MNRALRLSLVVAALAPTLALAAPPEGAETFSNGFWRLPTGGALPKTINRLPWIDAKGRLLYEPKGSMNNALRCFDPAPDKAADVQLFGPGALAVNAGADVAMLLRAGASSGVYDLYRLSCDTGETLVGTVDLSALSAGPGLGALPDGTCFFVVSQGILRLSPGAGGYTSSVISFDSLRPALRPGTEVLIKDEAWPKTAIRVSGLATEDGSLWLVLTVPDYSGAPAAYWVGRLLPDLTFELRLGPVIRTNASPTAGLGYHRGLGTLVVGGVTLNADGKDQGFLGLFTLDGHRKLDDGMLPAWPTDPGFIGGHDPYGYAGFLVPSGDGTLYAITLDGLAKLGVDEDAADLDGDGLLASAERARGLSDLEEDADGDGVTDGMELEVLHTDPLDPSSGAQPLPPTLLAPSTQIDTWPFPDPAWAHPADASGHLVCTGTDFTGSGMVLYPKAFVCVGEDGKQVGKYPGRAFSTPDGKTLFVLEQTGVTRRTLTGEVTATWPLATASGVYPVSSELAFVSTTSTVMRLHGDGTRCPVSGTPEPGTNCGATLPDPTIYSVGALGVDPTTGRLLVRARSMRSDYLASIGERDVQYLMRSGRFPQGVPPAQVLRIPGKPGFLTVGKGGEIALAGEGLDLRIRSPIGHHLQLGGWFRGGFMGLVSEMYKVPHETLGQNCKAAWGQITICDVDGPPKSWDDLVMFTYVQWMPIPAQPEPGEVVFFSAQSKPDLLTFRDTPMLWRYALNGGVYPWLDAKALAALADEPTRQLLAATPISKIRSLAFSPDGRRLCLAEPTALRTFELTLDENRVPKTLTLVAPGEQTVACGYADDGSLLRLVSGTVPRLVGTTTTELPSVKRPFGLVRYPGGFVVLAIEQSACISTTGSVQSIAPVHAATVVGSRLAFVDAEGNGHVQAIADFCQGLAPTERIEPESAGVSFWTATYLAAGTSSRKIPGGPGLLHRLPNGDFLVSHSGAPEGTDELEAHFSGWLYRYRATWGAGGLEAANWRQTPLVTIASHHAWSARCATTVPGAYTAPTDDWEFLGKSGPPAGPDAGSPEAPADAGTAVTKPASCGCQAGEGPLAAFLALGLAALVRRRSVR